MVAALMGSACDDLDQSLAEFRARYAATPTPPKSLYEGVEQGLRALKADDVGLAVWSNKPQALCEKVLTELGLSDLFDAVVGTARDVPHKPNPTGFDRALMLAGGERATSCFVGDTAIDHASARRVGVPFIWVTYGYGDAAPPDALVASDFAQARILAFKILERG
jgi:phosphoglycolate phosphatase